MKNIIITGAAGFIGSHLVDHFLNKSINVTGIDNLSTGKKNFIQHNLNNKNFTFIEEDLKNHNEIIKIFNSDIDAVFHIAANADVKSGLNHPRKDLEENTIVTFNVLEAIRQNNIKQVIFSSTGAIYGDAETIPTPESAPFPIQTSLYGASKLACEGLIQAYSIGYNIKATIFRFVSILGPRYSHGHVFDFYKQLKKDPSILNVLGDGNQKKSYLHVFDCINAIDLILEKSKSNLNIFNLGIDNIWSVKDSIATICNAMNVDPKLNFGIEKAGWIGDNPFLQLDITNLKSLGWKNKFTIKDSVRDTVLFLEKNDWLFSEIADF